MQDPTKIIPTIKRTGSMGQVVQTPAPPKKSFLNTFYRCGKSSRKFKDAKKICKHLKSDLTSNSMLTIFICQFFNSLQ
jgi:hypothetical protein